MNSNLNSNKQSENQVNKNYKFRLTSVFDQPPRVKTSSSPPNRVIIQNLPKSENNQIIMPSIVTNYNIQNINKWDNDKLKEELIKVKSEFNKRNKELSAIKIAYNKLDAENKKNMKIMDEILEEASKQKQISESDNIINENDIKTIVANKNFSENFLIKIKESNIMNSLRRQILDYKLTLESKEEEIITLKSTSKVVRYQEIDMKLKNTRDELNIISDSYNRLKKETKLKEVTEERDYYKAMMLRVKNQTDDNKEKLHYYLDQNNKLQELNKKYEERIKSFKFKENSLKIQLKEKETQFNILKEEMSFIELFKNERDKMEKSIANLNKNVSSLKEENDKKVKIIKEFDEIHSEYKNRIHELTSENKRLSESIRNNHDSDDKNYRIQQLEEDNLELKEEMEKLRKQIKSSVENFEYETLRKEIQSRNEEEENENYAGNSQSINEVEKKVEMISVRSHGEKFEPNQYSDRKSSINKSRDSKTDNFKSSDFKSNKSKPDENVHREKEGKIVYLIINNSVGLSDFYEYENQEKDEENYLKSNDADENSDERNDEAEAYNYNQNQNNENNYETYNF